MIAARLRYESLAPVPRTALAMAAVVLLNALYCLAYRYSAGNPATLAEAFSWGAINLAPWVAAIELGRQLSRAWQSLLVTLAAGAISLLLGAAYAGELPDAFELVRRLPGAAATLALLGGFEFYRRRRSANPRPEPTAPASRAACDWARAAGNYVELHSIGCRPQLARSTLARIIAANGPALIQIHRSIAVSPGSIAAIERGHVKLLDGTRLPIGNAYRHRISTDLFVPSPRQA